MRTRVLSRHFAGAFCLALVGLLATPSFASAGGVIQPCGPHLEHVREFKGHASFIFDESVQGELPGTTEFESISMQHHVLGVDVVLKKVVLENGRALFKGPATGGGVGIHDSLANQDSGFGGFLKFEGALHKKGAARGGASLILNRHKKHCDYAFGLSWAARAQYMGNPEVEPITVVRGGTVSAPEKIPDSLKLSGDQSLPTYLACLNVKEHSCSDLSGGWTNDFATLSLCHSIVAVGCEDDETTPLGAAEVNWYLKPVYEK
jgi:hypothetical protein